MWKRWQWMAQPKCAHKPSDVSRNSVGEHASRQRICLGATGGQQMDGVDAVISSSNRSTSAESGSKRNSRARPAPPLYLHPRLRSRYGCDREPTIVDRPAAPYAAIKVVVTMDQLGTVVPPLSGEV